MSILSWNDYLASTKQNGILWKSAARTTIAALPFSLFELAGSPGAGTLAGTDTTSGVIQTDALAGYPTINGFAAAALGYLTRIQASNTVACRLRLYDCLWKGGAYNYNAAVTLSAQPSYSTRLPVYNSSPDYKNLEIWCETVTAFTGAGAVSVNYTNQDGTTGRSTGATATAAAQTLGRMWQLPLQAGDSGVQKIESVTGTVASAGTFNVLVMRPLWEGRIRAVNDGISHGLDQTGMPQVFETSALFMMVIADGTSSGSPEIYFEVSNK